MNSLKKMLGPIGQRISQKLASEFTPTHLDIINESHMHSVPKGSETHFKVVVISDKFQKMSLLEKHRAV
jgi:BolA protein